MQTLGDDLQMVIDRLYIGNQFASENLPRLQLLKVSLVVQCTVGV